MQEEIKTEDRIKNWLKNRNNQIFLGIIVLAIVIRLYYFFMTKNQPLWWDESDYMAFAKHIAGFNINWIVSSQHNSLFPYLAAAFFKLGLSEVVIRFFLSLLPSILLVYFTYKILDLMYEDKRIALISAFLMATFWEILFNSMRLHLENLSLLLGFIAIYIFWQGYEKKEKIFGKINPNWTIPLAFLFVIMSYSLRRGYFFFGVFLVLYLLLTRKWISLLKDKYNWIAAVGFVILFFITEKLIFISNITTVAGTYYRAAPFSLLPFDIFKAFFYNLNNSTLYSIAFWLFWLGFIILIIDLALSYGQIREKKKSDLFLLITLAVVLLYFLLYQRRVDDFGEPRWYYPILLVAFLCICKSTLLIADYIKKYSKYLAIIVIVLLIGYSGWYQYQHADSIITNRLNSYNGVKQAGLYVNQNSNPQDLVMSVPVPQMAYYSERIVVDPATFLNQPYNENTTFDEFLAKLNVNSSLKYVVVSFSEPHHPSWMRIENQEYAQLPSGQVVLSKWEIPFANSTVDFINKKQDIKKSISYGNITFQLVNVFDEVFLYRINYS